VFKKNEHPVFCSFPHTPYFLYLNYYIIYIEYITVCVRVTRVREGDFA